MRFRVAAATVLLASFLAPTLWAQGLAPVEPESVGLSTERLARLEQVIQGYVDRGQVSGVVTLIARRGGQAHLRASTCRSSDRSTCFTSRTPSTECLTGSRVRGR